MKKKIYYALLFILLIGSVNVFAKPQEYVYADDNVSVKEEQDRTTFAFGNSVDVNANVNGASFAAGNLVKIAGNHDYLFTAGNNISLDEVTSKDAFIAGNSITIKDSTIRDLFVAGSSIDIDSPIERNISVVGDTIILHGVVGGDVYLEGENITVEEGTVVAGTLRYPEDANIKISENTQIGAKKTFKLNEANANVTVYGSFLSYIEGKIFAYCAMLVISFVLVWSCPKMFKKIEKMDKEPSSIFKTLGLGFLFLIVLPIVAIIAMCTVIGLSVGILGLLLYFVLIYLSVIPTAYFVGNWLLKDKIKNTYALMALSLLGIYVLRVIPIIGGWVTFLSLLFGLGAYTILFKQSIQKK